MQTPGLLSKLWRATHGGNRRPPRRACPARATDPSVGVIVPLPATVSVRDPPRGALPSPGHRLPGDLHIPHPPRRIARGRRCAYRSRHPHPAIRLGAEPGTSTCTCSSSMASTRSTMNGPACTVAAPRPSLNSSACCAPSPPASPAPSKDQGLLIRDDETPSFDLEPDDGFEQLLGAAVHYRIATGPHTGRKALTLRTVASNPLADNPCIAQLSGFSLHSPPEWCNRGSARAAEPMSGTLSNACAATSPAQHSRTNASRSMTAGRSCIDSSTPSVTGPLMSCSTRWNSCGTSVCRTPSGQPPAVQIGNPADLASPASSPLKCRSRSELALCRVPAPISPDTTACSPRTSSTAAVSSPNLPIKPPASLMRLVPRP